MPEKVDSAGNTACHLVIVTKRKLDGHPRVRGLHHSISHIIGAGHVEQLFQVRKP